jgi:hypothetical protein
MREHEIDAEVSSVSLAAIPASSDVPGAPDRSIQSVEARSEPFGDVPRDVAHL